MICGILSDTHNNTDATTKATNIFHTHQVEYIIHCGDWTTPATYLAIQEQLDTLAILGYGVFGNNDIVLQEAIHSKSIPRGKMSFPLNDSPHIIALEDKLCAIYHGHDRNIFYSLIESQKYDCIFTGHTHKVKREKIGKTLVLNPGSTNFSIPRSIDYVPTIMIYNSKNDDLIIENIR